MDNIEIDLPSKEDFNTLYNARKEEITSHYDYRDDYKFTIYTDVVTLTGRIGHCLYYYSSDVNETDKYSILYYYDGEVISRDTTNIDKFKNYNRYSRIFLVRPVLRFNNNPELFDQLPFEKNGDNQKYSKVEFGWAPRYSADNTVQFRLNEAYKKKELSKTGDVYTTDSVYIPNKNNYKKSFKPRKYPVYEFENKKYIRFKVYQCYEYDNLPFTKSYSTVLKNGIPYVNGEYLWIEVSKIPWIVDIERKTLIAQEGLLSGIQYENYSKDYNPIDYPNSNIKKYLDTYMKKEILCSEDLLLNKVDEKPKITNDKEDKVNEITTILSKIQEYKKYYLGNIDIETKVSNLLKEYNNELDKLAKNIDYEPSNLSIETTNPKLLYQKLLLNLEDILIELKTHGEKVKSYHDMIDILNECKKEEIDTSKDELCLIISNLKTIIIDFIANPKVKNVLKTELDRIIDKNVERNKLIIEEFKHNDNIKTQSLDELKLVFRKDLQPYLENTSKIVEKQDLVNEIMSNVKMMIDNHFTDSKNNMIKNYLSILNSVLVRIKERGSETDKEALNEIINIDFNIGDNIKEIIKKLELMIIKAYRIELDIEERNTKIKEIDELRVNVDIESIFKENTNTK